MEERRQAGALVGLGEHEQDHDPGGDHADQRQLAQRYAGRDQQRRDRERDHERRAHVGFDHDQQAAGTSRDRDRGDQRDQAGAATATPDPVGILGQEVRDIEDQRELQ